MIVPLGEDVTLPMQRFRPSYWYVVVTPSTLTSEVGPVQFQLADEVCPLANTAEVR